MRAHHHHRGDLGERSQDWLRRDDRLVTSDWCRNHPVDVWRKRRATAFWRAVVHVALTAIFTSMVILLSTDDIHHISHALRRFHEVYMGVSGTFGHRTVKLSDASEFDQALVRLQQTYFEASKKDSYSDDFPNLQPNALTVELLHNNGKNSVFNITKKGKHHVEHDFSKEGVRFGELGDVDFIDAHVYMPLLDFPRRAAKTICYRWLLDFHFSSMHSGQVDLGLKYTVHACEGYFTSPPWFMLGGLLAVVSLSLELRSVWCWWRRKMRHVQASTAAHAATKPFLGEEDGRETIEMDWWECLEGFDAWHIVAIAGNCAQVYAVYYASCVDSLDIYWRLNAIATSAALAWLNAVRYLAFFKPSYLLYVTLAVGVPKVLQFMIGVIPLYVAYAIMGVGLWGFDTEWFSTFSMSSASLFSLLNGDILHDSFLNLRNTNWFLAQVYLYSFLCLFIYVVLNIFITIIEESYFLNAANRQCELRSFDTRASATPMGDEAPGGRGFPQAGAFPSRIPSIPTPRVQESPQATPETQSREVMAPPARETGADLTARDRAEVQAQLDQLKAAVAALEAALR